jgi:DNA segregation ATPase FtsK/SpoIIIE, S-DNA-T family
MASNVCHKPDYYKAKWIIVLVFGILTHSMPFSSKSKQRAYQREYQRKRRKKTKKEEFLEPSVSREVKVALFVIILLVGAVLSILSFFDLAGPFGSYSKSALALIFGWGAYVFPVALVTGALLLLRGVRREPHTWQLGGVVILFFSLLGVLQHAPGFSNPAEAVSQGQGGGYAGFVVLYPFIRVFGYWGAWVFLGGLTLIGILLGFSSVIFNRKDKDTEDEEEFAYEEDVPIEALDEPAGLLSRIKEKIRVWQYRRTYNEEDYQGEPYSQDQGGTLPEELEPSDVLDEDPAVSHGTESDSLEPVTTKRARRTVQIPLDLLETTNEKPSANDLDNVKEKIEKTFATFGIHVEMDEVHIGPTVTQYTFRPPTGVKLSRITGLANELALALAAHPLRMEAPIPGKSLVGIEIPNQVTAKVKLKDILSSQSFKKRSSNLSICLGKDVSGKAWVADLSRMPHLLIAGSTGSGKSVAINAIIVSLLYQNSPDDLKLVLVDPKKVELTTYNDIPYLLTPVITDTKKTINSLKWVVGEMERRYQLLSNRGKRNIEVYNNANKKETIPHIVFIIDELADLMSVAARDVEAAIVRLAQMARAVGIHLILATQRPSVNVLTGLIKANIPSRIAFAVPSQIDSRTILDSAGAEKLLGRGDMLFTASDANKPRRLQGAYLDDEEIERVVKFLREQGEAEYHEEITETQRGVTILGDGASARDADDDLYIDAKEEIMRAGKASASLLQRRLRIGYARATRLLDLLEGEGIIGPADGAKPREILAVPEDSEASGGQEAYEQDSELNEINENKEQKTY